MKIIITILCAVATIGVATAQSLKFNKDKTFKIAQFTDVHFQTGKAESNTSLELFDEVIANEKPDLVVFTGDVVVEPAPVLSGWEQVLAPFRKAGIPVAVVLGNHDDEHDKSRAEITAYLATQPLCFSADGDYVLTINAEDGKAAAAVYMFDSNAYSTVQSVDGYGWVKQSQIANYLSASKAITEANGGTPLPAIAYLHIPLPEFTQAYNSTTHPPYGERGEQECSPKINTGLFAAMVESGDVMGCFAGHDHVNDYLAYLYNIALGYGRTSSKGTTYGDLHSGCRIVVLHQGERRFESYIRESGATCVQRSEYPRRLSLAITADTHFDMPPETDQYKNVMALNRLSLDGVAIVGDVFDHQHPSVVELFRRRYEHGKGDSTLHSQVYIGMGNHDINPVSTDSVKNIYERNITLAYVDSLLYAMRADGRISDLHKPTRNYSFELSGVHFVQTNTWAGDTTLAEGGLKWLAKNLKRYASQSEPVVLLMHYTFVDSQRWINDGEREALAQVLKGYNVLAIFNGHDHHAKVSQWNGIPVYTTDNAWKDRADVNPSFYHIEYTPKSGLSVKRYSWDNQTMQLTIEK